MTKAAQNAIVILAAVVVLLTGAFVTLAIQQSHASDRNACITSYRTQWERSIGDMVETFGQGGDIRGRQVRRLDDVQHDLAQLDDRCPLDPWWRL